MEVHRRNAIRLRLVDFLEDYTGNHGPCLTEVEMVLLGTASDAAIAAKVNRTVNAVRLKRNELRIPPANDRRRPPATTEKASPNHPWRKGR